MLYQQYRFEIVMHLLSLLTLVIVVAIFSTCRDKSSPPTIPVVPDTTFISQPQVDIPWPSLANSPWPMFLHDPQHTGRSPYRGPQLGQVEWLFDARGNVYSSPVIDQAGNIYFAALQGNFFCVSPSGTLLWQHSGGGGDSNPLISNDGTIYVFGDSTLYAYNPGGMLKWRVHVAAGGTSSPVISKDGNTIYVPRIDFVAIRKDGTIAWRIRPDSSDLFHYESAFSIDGTTLYVSGYYKLYAIDTSGVIKWRFTGNPSSVAVDNAGNLYFTSEDKLFSLTPNGTVRWVRDSIFTGGFDVGPTIGRDGSIYLAGGYLYAFDNAGKLRWKYYPFSLLRIDTGCRS